jgi:hypothetical protein
VVKLQRPTVNLPLVAFLGIALVFSCGPDAGNYPILRDDPCLECEPDVAPEPDLLLGEVGIPDVPLEDWDTTGAGPLTGIFAVEAIVLAKVVIDVETRQLFRLRILQTGTYIRQTVTMCELSLPSVAGIADLIITPQLREVMRRKVVEAEGDYLSSADPVGADYLPDPVVVVVGAELDDPGADDLPTPDDLSTAVDEDDDGFPGITVEADVVVCDGREQLYAALRTVSQLEGVVEDINTITGTVTPELDVAVLDYSDPCLAVAANLPIEMLEGSTFRAVRLSVEHDIDENGNVSCAEVSLSAEELFGEYWGPAEIPEEE